MLATQPSPPPIPDLERLRRLGIWMPVIAMGLLFGLVEVLTLYLYPLPNWSIHVGLYLLVMGIISAGAYLFSHLIFRLVREKEQVIIRRNQELSALHAVGAVINESLDLDAVLSRALDRVLEVTRADAGEIFLREEGSQELVLRAFRGLYSEAFREITRFQLNEGYPGRIAAVGKPLVVHDLSEDPRFLRRGVKQAGFQSFAGLPLRSKGKIVGVMEVFALDPSRLTSEDVELLGALGNQIGVAIENARLYAQLKTMTVVEERHRIAREMHDGLAQELGYLYLKMGALEANPSISPVQEEIGLMKKVVARAYEEVRQAIFGLKMMVSRGLGLIPTLAEYLHEFSEQTGIAVKLKVPDERATRFSPHAEIQLIRIVQEALTNVRKHAQARHAWVIFDTEGAQAKVTVQDDGRGFDPGRATQPGRASFGLQTMRERAESAGGALKVESEGGKGTRVIVWLPMGRKESGVWRR